MAKNILLIGASGGLGKHFANSFAAEGCNLALVYKEHHKEAGSLAGDVIKHNIKAKTYEADITSEIDIEKLVTSAVNDFGSIDVLINNAGLSLNAMSWKMDIDSWNKVLAVNLTGPFLCIKHVIPV